MPSRHPTAPARLLGTVHAAGIELYDAFFVRQATEPDGHVLGIELGDVHAGHDRIDRVGAGDDHVIGFLDAANAVVRRDDDGPRERTSVRGQSRHRAVCGRRLGGERRAERDTSGGRGAGGEKITA
jgi:hypothetical protein